MSEIRDSLVLYLKKVKEDTKCKGFVIGLSGGIDSAVVTKLAADAVGGDKILNIFMPTSSTPKEDSELTSSMAELWGTEYREIDITPALDMMKTLTGATEKLDIGNLAARIRMTVLYANARMRDYIVIGTSNKSELMMGYFTKYGDGACDALVISELYKTQVRELASEISVPKEIIDRPPSAGLWEGQTDESDMGISYHDLDIILDSLDDSADPRAKDVRERVGRNGHKRNGPLTPPKVY